MDADTVPEEDGLLFGCVLDGRGGARLVGWADVAAWQDETGQDKTGQDEPGHDGKGHGGKGSGGKRGKGAAHRGGALWLHLDRDSPHAQRWLREASGLTPATVDGMLAEETRPRVFRGRLGTVAILRGVNTNPHADPEDMVAIRMWSDGRRVITVRQRRLMTPRDILHRLLDTGDGPRDAAELYERLIARLCERMASTVSAFEDALDELETGLEEDDPTRLRRQLSDARHDMVLLRRYMAPQREALNALVADPPGWLGEHGRAGLRETTDRLTRYIEELDAARERALVMRDDVTNRVAESTNRRLYVLSIVSAVFLPLGFITGLLGINVGGMPGVDNANAFWIASLAMLAVLVLEIVVMRRMKWF